MIMDLQWNQGLSVRKEEGKKNQFALVSSCLEKKRLLHFQQLKESFDGSSSLTETSASHLQKDPCKQIASICASNVNPTVIYCFQTPSNFFYDVHSFRRQLCSGLKQQPTWLHLSPFHTKDNVTQNLYLQTLKISHRPFGKFIVILQRLVFFFQCTLLQKPAQYLSAIWALCTYQAKISRFPSLSLLCRRQIRLGKKQCWKIYKPLF